MLKILINHRLFFILFFVWLIILACLQLLFTQTELMFWVNRNHNSILDIFFQYVTLLGEDGVWLGIFLIYVYQYYVKRKEVKYEAIMLIIIWIAKGILSISLKNIFSHPRPMEVYQTSGRAIHLVEGVNIHHWYSFPSGHTFTAFAMACFFILIANKRKEGLICLLIAALVGYSRMYLFQHFPRDVFAGGIFGIAVVVACALIKPNLKTIA